MQVTIDLPDELAARLGTDPKQWARVVAWGLHRGRSASSRLRQEVIAFLARRPTAEEISAFHPSAAAVERARLLLERDKRNELSIEEQSELDEICDVDRFVSLIKAEVQRQFPRAS